MDSSRTRRDRSGHKGTIALVLAGLAVVIATTGTAVAVTASTVKISDSKYPKRIARVDSTGHLLTRNSTSTLPAVTTISSSDLLTDLMGDNFVTSPTTATLAITKIGFSETASNAGVAGSNFRVYVYKVGVDASGNCASTGYVKLAIYQFNAGDEVLDQFPQPLIVKPTGAAKYCLDLYSTQLGSGTPGYFPVYTVNAYVVSGKYKGIGTFASPARKSPARVGANGDGK